MLKDGDFTHAELMMGTNQDEGILKLFNCLSMGLFVLPVVGIPAKLDFYCLQTRN